MVFTCLHDGRLRPRALEFDQVGYRVVCEEINKTRQQYGHDPDWQDWFRDTDELKRLMEKQIPMTAAQLANPEQPRQLVRVWTTLAGYNADTKDVYQVRYQGLLT